MTDQHTPDPGERLRESWVANADAWTASVRGGRIPSRRLGTDAAILAACLEVLRAPARARVLDVGCGEGWLSRALAAHGAHVVGIDGSAPLVTAAGNVTPAGAAFAPEYAVVSYEELAADPALVSGPFDLAVCNYALFLEELGPTLSALRRRLAPHGAVVIQTVHPWGGSEHAYADGWREESFASFEQRFPAPMPWFHRTMSSWVSVLADARLAITALEEPLHPETGRPMSLIMTARAHGVARLDAARHTDASCPRAFGAPAGPREGLSPPGVAHGDGHSSPCWPACGPPAISMEDVCRPPAPCPTRPTSIN